MSKRKLISLSIIGLVAVVAIGATIAYFNDTETSTGNILVAGNLDLKVDHLLQTYNGVDCNTCNLTLISDPTNIVVKKNDAAVDPYPAVFVSWIHPAWTAQNDPDLLAANAKWIWESDPTRQEDTTNTVTYTFQKTFEWYGPILSSDLWFAIGSDNSIVVTLNGTVIATNPMEFGYQQEHMLHIPAADVNDHVVQGTNVLTFDVTNWALANGNPKSNPAGLIYKFFISGNCQDSYFKSHCQLWGEKDLTNEHFWDFDDVKPGDRGTNLISLHINDNDSWACLLVNNKQDNENTWLNPEQKAGDVTENMGELSQFIKVFGWDDSDKDGIYQAGEATLFQGSLANPVATLTVADSTQGPQIPGDTTKYVGLAWCFGNQTVDTVNGVITCDGSGVSDVAQSDSLIADLTAYAEQWRNNGNFTCESLNPHQLINGGFEDGTNGWTVTGSNAVVDSYLADEGLTEYEGPTYNPVEGNKFLVLTAGLDTDVYTIASQQVTLSAGEKLQGWAAYDAKDYLPFEDDAAVVIVSGGPLATPWSEDVSNVGNYGESPWVQWSFTAPSDGTYTLELKVRNTLDNSLSPSALFDANVVAP